MADFIEGKGSPLGERVVKTYERLKGDRVNWDEHWEDLAEYFMALFRMSWPCLLFHVSP